MDVTTPVIVGIVEELAVEDEIDEGVVAVVVFETVTVIARSIATGDVETSK